MISFYLTILILNLSFNHNFSSFSHSMKITTLRKIIKLTYIINNSIKCLNSHISSKLNNKICHHQDSLCRLLRKMLNLKNIEIMQISQTCIILIILKILQINHSAVVIFCIDHCSSTTINLFRIISKLHITLMNLKTLLKMSMNTLIR